MEFIVRKTFYDVKEGATRNAGSLADVTAARADEVNAAFPGTLEKVEKPRRAPRKKADGKA